MSIHDVPRVLVIEKDCFQIPWSKEDFEEYNKSGCISIIATDDEDHILGYCVFSRDHDDAQIKQAIILNVAVRPEWRKRGVLRMMIDYVKDVSGGQDEVSIILRETNLSALNAFKQLGFVAIGLIRQLYEDTNEDGIAMEWQKHP